MLASLAFIGGDDALIEALRAGHPGAAAVFFDRHAGQVHRTLLSIMGPDADVSLPLQDVFSRAVRRVGELRDYDRVRRWLTTITISVARVHLRRERWRFRLRRWFGGAGWMRGRLCSGRDIVRETFGVLDSLPVDDRIAFCLRVFEGMSLVEAADCCQVSLTTLRRRLSRAERAFVHSAGHRPAFQDCLGKGATWVALNQS